MPPILDGLRALRPAYDAFLIDLWGVVHDGVAPYRDVIAALDALRRSGATIYFLSNSSREGAHLASALEEMGISPSTFDGVVSSGDVTLAALKGRDPNVFAHLGPSPKCLHVGDASYVPWLSTLPLTLVDDVDGAEIILSTGTVADEAALDAIGETLAPAAARAVPLVCSNPDRVVETARGRRLAPGAIAERYRQLGGPTHLYGKPYAPIYAAALARMTGIAPARIVALGDFLETDILGASRAGLASVLVASTGVHARELGIREGESPAPTALEALLAHGAATPTAVLASLRW